MNRDAILDARERKVEIIERFYKTGNTVLTIQANIPSGEKNSFEAYFLVRYFHNYLNKFFSLNSAFFDTLDGPYFLSVIDGYDPIELKKQIIEIESTHSLGKFIDIDVFTSPQKSISRTEIGYELRKCYLCEEPALICARSQKHGYEEIINYIKNSVTSFIESKLAEIIDLSITTELELEDKYGLVTKTSCGSHKDMNYNLMMKAKDIISPYFLEMFKIGMKTTELTNVLDEIKPIAITIEQKMYLATNNVNCYKGLIYVLGITAVSAGYALKNVSSFTSIFSYVQIIAKNVLRDFLTPGETFGKVAYEKYNLKGIRGEVYNGLPHVRMALPFLESSVNYESLHCTLNFLISTTEDTVLLKRTKNIDTYYEIKEEIKSLNPNDREQIKKYTEKAIENNYSFGGSADLLVVCLFLTHIRIFY